MLCVVLRYIMVCGNVMGVFYGALQCLMMRYVLGCVGLQLFKERMERKVSAFV